MRTELFISWRYLVAKRKEKFISLISIISILGVAIGVTAMIVVLAVMTGFDRDLREKIVGNYSHITAVRFNGIEKNEYIELEKKIKSNTHVVGVSPYVQGLVLVKEADKFFAVGIKGVFPETETTVTKINQYLASGSIQDLTPGTVILGKELALYLGLGLGSQLSLISPAGKPHSLKVVGIFESGMYEYDMNLIFAHAKTSQEILGIGDKFTAVAVKLDNLYLAGKVREELSRAVGYDYDLKTWMEANKNFFAALQLEKLTMFIILALIVLVASFNIISTLIVIVVEKTKDIGILKAIGMSSAGIRRIFIYEGLVVGILGTFFGTAGGIALCGLLKKYQFIKLPQDIYYIDRLPVSIAFWPDIFVIILAAMVITLVSTVYPASRAARLAPVEALKYE